MEWPEEALALIIVLDQLPRNIFRGSACCYMADPLACETARRAIARGLTRRQRCPRAFSSICHSNIQRISRSGAQYCAFPQHGRRRAHQLGLNFMPTSSAASAGFHIAMRHSGGRRRQRSRRFLDCGGFQSKLSLGSLGSPSRSGRSWYGSPILGVRLGGEVVP